MENEGKPAQTEAPRFQVAIAPDRMQAHLTVWLATAQHDTEALTAAILGALRQAGVVKGLDEWAVRHAVETAKSTGEPAQGIVAAQGQPAVDGADARVVFHFRLGGRDPGLVAKERMAGNVDEAGLTKSLVRAGNTLAVVEPPQPGAEGFTVTGEILAPKPAKSAGLKAGAGVQLLEDGRTCVATPGVIGFADFAGETLQVDPLVRVAKDGMTAWMDAYPPADDGIGLETAEVISQLEALGVVHGVLRESVAAALSQARATGAPVRNAVIALGTPPKRGTDAHIAFLFRREPLVGWTDEEDASIDYRERGFFQAVCRGDALARKTPATPGECGHDLYGKEIASVPGQDVPLEIAGDVELSEDGLECRATADGVVISVGSGTVGVFQEYTIPGDVDLHTGNLEMKGALAIQGWVRAGFKVHASGNLVIGGGIEAADVKTDGNLIVKGGIAGGAQTEVISRGAVAAQFIENACVRASGDVTVRDGILNSQVTGEGCVAATDGKGYIIGGTVRAAKSIEVNELGSRAGLHTVVDVGVDSATRAKLAEMERDCASFERNQQKILKVLAALVQKGKAGKLDAREAQTLARLARYRRDIELKRRNIAGCWKRLEATEASIKVRKAAYDGVVVQVLGQHMHVREDLLQPGEFVLDREQGRVVYKT